MNSSPRKRFNAVRLLFLAPIALAFLFWAYFPAVAQWIVSSVFRYDALEQAANSLWLGLVGFFYMWYTFLALGVGGIWIVAASLARRRRVILSQEFYPMVSFVVPAFNEEANIGDCIKSLHACAEAYKGNCEIIVVDDGSTDSTFEVAQEVAKICHSHKRIMSRWKVVRHMTNLGKAEALRTGVNVALGQMIAVVDADTMWLPNTLGRLVDSASAGRHAATTGYVHPKTSGEDGFLISLQQLEYSQGVAIDRCAQSLGGRVVVVPGAIGIYDADLLRKILGETTIHSVTEDSEITLEMQKRGGHIGYVSKASSNTNAPRTLEALWRQRIRWSTGWLHNVLGIHASLLLKISWLSALLWYSVVFEFVGALVDVAALVAFPFLFWFAPDRMNFALNLVVYVFYGLLIVAVSQAIALRFAYGDYRHLKLLRYTASYPILWIVNLFARLRSIVAYATGSKNKWR